MEALALLFPCLSFAAGLAAQSGSPLLAIGQGLSVDGATGTAIGFDSKSVVMVESDFDTALPAPLPPVPGLPDFTLLPFPPGIDIDALSLGWDWVLADSTGHVSIPPNHWGAPYSVRRTTVGVPGSVVAAEAVAPGGAAGDIFAYVLPGSAMPSPPAGVPFRALDSTEINIDAPLTAANIDAHDALIGLLYVDNPAFAATLPPPTVYFSVTAATVGLIPAGWTSVPALRSGATVFSTTWSPGSASWTVPIVALTPAALGLTSGEDLDDLALDTLHGRVLFSTDRALPPPLPAPPRDQLLYSNLGSGINVTYRLPVGTPVETELGVGSAPDDIDGICALDPGDQAQPSQIRLDRMLGSCGPNAFPGFATPLQASVYRRNRGPGQDSLVSYMTGWPPPGTPSPGLAAVGWSANGAAGPWEIAGFFLRPNPGSPYYGFAGHPEKWAPTVPPGFTLSNIPITVVWAALDATQMVLSLPVTIVL